MCRHGRQRSAKGLRHINTFSGPLFLGIIMLLACAMAFAAETGPSAEDLMQRGRLAAQQGALEEALVSWKEAAQIYDKAGDAKGQIQALSHAAYAARTLGHLNQAFLQQELALHPRAVRSR